MRIWIRRLAVLAATVALALGFGLTLAAWAYQRQVLRVLAPELDRAASYRPPGSVVVLDRNGDEIDAFWREKRVWIPLEGLPRHVWGALIAAEDRRFFEHGGVDYRGILRAALANAQDGGVSQGASTLTQQLVKNLIVGKDRTYARKVREAIAAWELERRLGKQQVLELYLNYVYLGSGNHGIEAAARDYFGVPAAELTPGQAALLAALIPAPSRFDPRIDPSAARQRRDRVLQGMVETGHLHPERLQAALDEPVTIEAGGVSGNRSGAAYVTQVRRDLVAWFGDEAPFELAMRVHTPFDPAVQQSAEAAVREQTTLLMQRHGVWAIVQHLRTDSERAEFLAVTAPDPADGECFHALLRNKTPWEVQTRSRTWKLAKGQEKRLVRNRLRLEGGSTAFYGTALVGDEIRVCRAGEEVVLDGSDWIQGAAVVIDHATGEVIALVGGNEPALEGFVRATQALRQPGSAFKPFVYAAAIEQGRSQTLVMTDEKVTLIASDGTSWTPGVDEPEPGEEAIEDPDAYRGDVPLRTALAASLNTISVKLVNEVGPDVVAATARRMGIRTPLNEVLSLALGSSEVTVLELATGFGTIANGGIHREPRLVRRIEDRSGTLLGVAGGLARRADGTVLGEIPGRTEQAISPGVAYEMADMLTSVVENGTGMPARKRGHFRAGKTGTTNAATDTWFAGFTPRYTVAVWVGTDDNGSLGSGNSGSKTALPIWRAIVDTLPAAPEDAIPVPPEAMRIPWNGLWVGVNRQTVPRSVWAVERIGDEPIPPFPRKP